MKKTILIIAAALMLGRQAATGLLVAASTICADLTGYVGHVDVHRLMGFGLAGLLAAAIAGFVPFKKSPACIVIWLIRVKFSVTYSTAPAALGVRPIRHQGIFPLMGQYVRCDVSHTSAVAA